MTVEAVRLSIVLGGFFVIGFNFSVIAHAPRIVSAVGPWRLFMAGKIFFTFAVMIVVHRNLHAAVGWPELLVAFGMLTTLLSMLMLEHSYRIHKQHVPAFPVAPARAPQRR